MSDHVQALFIEGYNHYTQGREPEALACFDAVIAAAPHYAQARNNRAVLLQNVQRYEEALQDVDALLRLGSNTAQTHAMRGRIMLRLNRFAEVQASYARVRELDSSYPLDVYEDAFCALMLGDFASGWRLHEARWGTDSMHATTSQRGQRGYAQPLWLGRESLAGKTILLWPEQGYGDVIQFCRYVPIVRQMGAKVILTSHPSILRLLQNSFAQMGVGGIEVVPDLVGSPYSFDFHCPLMSLPLACGTDSLAKIPNHTPYLFAADADIKAYREAISHMARTSVGAQPLRIGLVWAGGTRPNQPELHSIDAARSLALWQFEPLLVLAQQKNAQIFSLQLGEPAQQLEAFLQERPALSAIDLTPTLKDWAGTAALIANLDLVISCDTAVAHLAAAMDKPTWILSRFNGCWRWLDGRDDSPWYSSVRLFRQTTRGDWASVIAQVTTALQTYD
jgi:tetratricopeptide (TPR) repeat protein